MGFSQQEATSLNEALLSAYNRSTLEQMLYFNLDKRLNQIAGSGGTLRDDVFAVIQTSEMEGWTSDLVHAAHDANPGNPKLKSFVAQYIRFTGAKATLEKIIQKSNSFLDVATWRSKLERIERQVCSIEIDGEHEGTGFLINHDLVMTNYHVVEKLLGDSPQFEPQKVRCRFDFKKSDSGEPLNDGIRYTLASEGWLVDSSPYGVEEGKNNFDATPEPTHLDYAILRLAQHSEHNATPGKEPVKGFSDKTRGWIKVAPQQKEMLPDTALFIMQHPSGAPLKMALSTNSVIGLNDNSTRLRHRTNTEPGSSGSACFNSEWDLVALHHAGDTTWNKPEWNQAVPINAILDLWSKNGTNSIVSGEAPAAASDSSKDNSTGEFSADDEMDAMLQG